MFEEAEFDDFDDNVAPSQQLLDDSSSSDPPTAPASPARTFGPNCGFGGSRRGAGGGSAAAVMNNSSSLTAPLTVPTPSAAFENTPDNKARRRQALLQQREELGAGGGGGAFFKAGREDNATKAFGSSSSTSAATTTSDARMRNRRHSSNIDNALTAAERRHKAHNDTRLHRPGDKQYRFTCAPPTATNSSNNSKNNSNNNSGNRYDDTFVSGDAWGSNVCHCMVCEMSTAMSLVKAREEEMRGVGGGEHSNSTNAFSVPTPPPTVILWDLDNFGFKHMMIEASRLAKHTNFEAEASIESIGTRSGLANYMATLLNNDCDEGGGGGRRAMLTSPSASSHGPSSQAQTQQQHHRLIGKNQKRNQRAEDGGDHKVLSFAQNTFFWFFHGACFARRHDTTPLDYVASLREDDPSLWGVLQRHSGGLLFTPCGGHSQAADEVMLCIALGFFPSAENSNTPAGHHHGQKRARDDSPPQLALPHLPPFPTVVVTRDKGLREMIAALAGGGSSNEHSSKDMGGGRAVDGGATNNNNRNDMATPNRNTAAACSPTRGAPIGHGGRGGGKANATSKANAKAAATSSPLSATILSQDQSSSHTPKANVGGGGGGGGASFTAAVRCVDPQATGGTFVPFWAELTRSVEDARREFAAVTMMAEMLQQ